MQQHSPKQQQRESQAEPRRDDEPRSDEAIHTDPWADWTSDSPRIVVGPLDI